MRLFGIFPFILLLARGQYTHEWSWDVCGGSPDDNQLLPGLNGHVLSLDVECDPRSNSTVLSWSNGGLQLASWSALYIGYTCAANETNENIIKCIPVPEELCGGIDPALSSSTHTLTATLGTECAFLGCYVGGFAYQDTWFTFSSQTCTLPSDIITATPTPSMSHTTVQPTNTAELGGSTAYSSAIPDTMAALTPTPHTTVQSTDTAGPGGSATYSSAIPDKTTPTTSPMSTYVQPESPSNQIDSPSSVPVLAWLVPVVLVTCVTAVIGVTIATCYFITRDTSTHPGKREVVFLQFYRSSIAEERPNPIYKPVSTHSLASIESDKSDFENERYESNESEAEEVEESSKEEEHESSTTGQSKKSDIKDETLQGCSADTDKGYLNVRDATSTSFAEDKIIERSECPSYNAVNESSGQNRLIPEVVTDSETRLTGNEYSSELGKPIYVQDTDFIGREQILNEYASQEVKVNIWDDVRSDSGDCFNDIAGDGRDNKID